MKYNNILSIVAKICWGETCTGVGGGGSWEKSERFALRKWYKNGISWGIAFLELFHLRSWQVSQNLGGGGVGGGGFLEICGVGVEREGKYVLGSAKFSICSHVSPSFWSLSIDMHQLLQCMLCWGPRCIMLYNFPMENGYTSMVTLHVAPKWSIPIILDNIIHLTEKIVGNCKPLYIYWRKLYNIIHIMEKIGENCIILYIWRRKLYNIIHIMEKIGENCIMLYI